MFSNYFIIKKQSGKTAMNNHAHKICFTALAFISVLQSREEPTNNDVEKILRLSRLVEAFCSQYAETIFPLLSNDKSATETDADIASILDDMRASAQEPKLPQDREALVRLYDRLSQRNFRRKNWLLYAKADTSDLVPLIHNALKDELRADL